jgi:hypothetical protein
MKAWKKFAETLELTRELEDTYFKIRKIFRREGWTQKDIERPPYYPNDLMFLHSKIQQLIQETDQTIRDYGFDVDEDEVSYYIIDKLRHIDDITPLKQQ